MGQSNGHSTILASATSIYRIKASSVTRLSQPPVIAVTIAEIHSVQTEPLVVTSTSVIVQTLFVVALIEGDFMLL